MRLGGLESRPGKLVCGFVELLPLPSGRAETWPIMLLQGRQPGPTLWITANIHGNELTGISAVHRLVREELAEKLRGTIVAVPSLNPAGLLTLARAPYYWAETSRDPNRQFPSLVRREASPTPHSRSAYEQAAAILFDWIGRTADLLLDLHCATLQSVPHVIRDRVLYVDPSDRPEAERVAEQMDALARSLGLPVVNEFPARRYVDDQLDRSLSGACVNVARIPALTVELGAPDVVDPIALEAGVTALRNALIGIGMVDGSPQSIATAPAPRLSYPLRRENQPRAPAAGLVSYCVAPGATIGSDDIVAEVHDLFGRPVGDGNVRAGQEGWIIALGPGLGVYAHQALATMGVRDGEPVSGPHPDFASPSAHDQSEI